LQTKGLLDGLTEGQDLKTAGTVLTGIGGGIKSYYDNKSAEDRLKKEMELRKELEEKQIQAQKELAELEHQQTMERDDSMYERTRAKYQPEVVSPTARFKLKPVAPTVRRPNVVSPGLLERSV
jgi:hypothetical protein